MAMFSGRIDRDGGTKIPIIRSEITTRISTANATARATLLMILLPWIHNIALIDPSIPKSVNGHDLTFTDERGNAFLQGIGWGSVQSTELVLNNLFYLTATVKGLSSSSPVENTNFHLRLVFIGSSNGIRIALERLDWVRELLRSFVAYDRPKRLSI